MKNQTFKNLIAGALLLGGTQIALRAQQYSIGWDVIAGGGGTSANSQYSLSGTISQWDAGGPMTAGHDSLTGGFWKMPGGPVLTIQLTGPDTLTISWPVPVLGCFVLQQTTSLTAPNWVDVPTAVTFASGTDSVVVSIPGSDQFYRLLSNCQDQ